MNRTLITILAALTLTFTLSGCGLQTIYENYKTESVTVVVTEEDILQLEDYPNLVSADLTGSTCYTAIEEYKAAHPEVEVTYDIEVLGTFYDPHTTELDLSFMEADQIPALLEALDWLPDMASINLMAEDGTAKLGVSDVKLLLEAHPEYTYNYQFEFYGQILDLYQERAEYIQVEMGDESADALREVLSVLQNCTYFKVDRCGFTSEVLDTINKEFPDTKVVWRVFYGRNGTRFNALTDETVIRSSHYLTDSTVSEMKYLTDVVYMDIGHNETLHDISFIQNMPNLKLLILSGAPVTDITPLTGLEHLEFLELCFCSNLVDLNPINTLTGLKYLNISGTYANDISCLMDMELERFNCILNRVPMEQKDAYEAAHPDCLTVKTGKQPYGYGWRYIDDGYNFNDYYATMRLIFHYDEEALLNGYEWERVTATDPDWDL